MIKQKLKQLLSVALILSSFGAGFVAFNPGSIEPIIRVIAASLGYGTCPYGSGAYSNNDCAAVAGTSLNLKVNLAGAYNTATNLMRTDINTIIPLAQPYTAAPFSYTGTEVATTIATDIVDWVLIEVKDAAGTTTVAKKAALLKSNSVVVDATAGATTLTLPTVTTTGQYKVIVRHRNHIAIATDVNITLTAGASSTLDLTGNVNVKAANQLPVGAVFAMRMANINGDDSIDALDRNLSRQAGPSVAYESPDVNLDGSTDSLDRVLTRAAPIAIENL
jgi:hypothetical protein